MKNGEQKVEPCAWVDRINDVGWRNDLDVSDPLEAAQRILANRQRQAGEFHAARSRAKNIPRTGAKSNGMPAEDT